MEHTVLQDGVVALDCLCACLLGVLSVDFEDSVVIDLSGIPSSWQRLFRSYSLLGDCLRVMSDVRQELLQEVSNRMAQIIATGLRIA